jgi:hypothetical protein
VGFGRKQSWLVSGGVLAYNMTKENRGNIWLVDSLNHQAPTSYPRAVDEGFVVHSVAVGRLFSKSVIIIITFCVIIFVQGMYSCTPEGNLVFRVYSVAAALY